ncbi:hypothetical protein RUM44_009234 [Polyplax serrata]|uniref:Inner centromere protein ARK-binding domain-containing protein n=1 Tax=Polyplax serrata TaxID=468196 RepID=A0ABR1AS39_POLSC
MNNPKTIKVLRSLNSRVFEIYEEVDGFVGDILQWANELESIVEKEFLTGKNEESVFQLPKTPCESKRKNGRTKTNLVSKHLLGNSTLGNDTVNLDTTRSRRTRAATRQLPSKVSKINNDSDKHEVLAELKKEVIDNQQNKTILTNQTFVLPVSHSTRTKPVVRKEQENKKDAVADITMDEGVNNSTLKLEDDVPSAGSVRRSSRLSSRSPVRESSRKILRTVSDSAGCQRQSRSIFSTTLSESPVKQISNNQLQVPHSSSKVESSEKTSLLEPPIKRKISRALSESPMTRPSKISKTFSVNPEDFYSRNNRSEKNSFGLSSTTTISKSPIKRSTRIATLSGQKTSSLSRSSSIKVSETTSRVSQKSPSHAESATVADTTKGFEACAPSSNKTTSNMFTTSTTTYLVDEEECPQIVLDEGTPKISGGKFMRLSKTSTPVAVPSSSRLLDGNLNKLGIDPDGLDDYPVIIKSEEKTAVFKNDADSIGSMQSNKLSSASKKKKKKTRKTKKSEEKVEEEVETIRITRTKSKAIKGKTQESVDTKQQEELTDFAKKLINKAKMNSQKKIQLAALLEQNACMTPKHFSGIKLDSFLPGVSASKNKCQMILSTSKKLKTPLATLSNSAVKKPQSCDKDRLKTKVTKRDSSVENLRSAGKVKHPLESENKLKTKKNKEDEAALKRQKVIQSKQEELKRKNELKHQLALKQREKLEQEKYNNMIQSEKEKEERHKLILQERQLKQKEETFRKKLLKQQKIAETVERRRLEEEARLAKLKEMEAEEQRIALEKQKEQERQEKREQERLALKKAKEEYEQQLKQELEAERLRAEKVASTKKYLSSASKMLSASKKPMFGLLNGDRKDWDYKPRNEFDYGLDGENSELDSDDERPQEKSKPMPIWAKKVMNRATPMLHSITLEMLCEYMQCSHKTPDINKMFNITPTKKIKRTSSAIWNTPTS